MHRTNVYITDEQFQVLGKATGALAEHIRKALDDYIEKLKPKSTASASKGGAYNG